MLETGSVVTLVNGLFDMTVESVDIDTVTCKWFTGSTLNTATFFKKDITLKDITNG